MVGHSFQNYDRVYAGFSAAYTCLNTIRMGFEPIYTTIKITYIRVFKWGGGEVGQFFCSNARPQGSQPG